MSQPLTPEQFKAGLGRMSGVLMNTAVEWIYEQTYAVYAANAALCEEMRAMATPKILSPAEKTSALMGPQDD